MVDNYNKLLNSLNFFDHLTTLKLDDHILEQRLLVVGGKGTGLTDKEYIQQLAFVPHPYLVLMRILAGVLGT